MLYIRRVFNRNRGPQADAYSYKYSASYLQKMLNAIKAGLEVGSNELRSRLNPLFATVDKELKKLDSPCRPNTYRGIPKSEESARKISIN